MLAAQSYSTRNWDALNPGLRGLAALGATKQYDPTGANANFKPVVSDGSDTKAECELYLASGKLPGRLVAPPPVGSSPAQAEQYLAFQAAQAERFASTCGGGGAKGWLLALGGLATIGVTLGILYSKKAAFGL